jgi:hypothetical protein
LPTVGPQCFAPKPFSRSKGNARAGPSNGVRQFLDEVRPGIHIVDCIDDGAFCFLCRPLVTVEFLANTGGRIQIRQMRGFVYEKSWRQVHLVQFAVKESGTQNQERSCFIDVGNRAAVAVFVLTGSAEDGRIRQFRGNSFDCIDESPFGPLTQFDVGRACRKATGA